MLPLPVLMTDDAKRWQPQRANLGDRQGVRRASAHHSASGGVS